MKALDGAGAENTGWIGARNLLDINNCAVDFRRYYNVIKETADGTYRLLRYKR